MPFPFLATATVAESGDFSWMESLGPYAAFGVLAMIVLRMMHKEMLRREDVLGGRIKDLEGEKDELSDKFVTMAERVGPILAEAARVLSEAVEALSERQSK